jgi:hypothetical protein
MNKELQQLDIVELGNLFDNISADPERAAQNLFPEYPGGCRGITESIGEWAIHQKIAMECRNDGKGDVALVFAKHSERIWRRLPDYARRVRVKFEDQLRT